MRNILLIVVIIVALAIAIYLVASSNDDEQATDDSQASEGAPDSDVDASPASDASGDSRDNRDDRDAFDHTFTPPLNEGPAPPREEWTRTGIAISPDGRILAVSWWYEDMSDPFAAFSGAIDLFDVATGEKRTTVEGIPGGLCGVDPGHRGCLQWHPDSQRLGFVFNTNAVGVIDTTDDNPKLIDGIGDPTGTDTGPAWTFLDGERKAVGFMADYRRLGSGNVPLSIWNPNRKRLLPVELAGGAQSLGRRYVSIGPNTLVGLGSKHIVVASLEPPEQIAHLPQSNEYNVPGALSAGDYSRAYAREHVSPDHSWLLSRDDAGIVLYSLPNVERERTLTPIADDQHASDFCWGPESRRLVLVVRGRRSKQRSKGRLLLFDDVTTSEPRTLDDPPRSVADAGLNFDFRDLCAFSPDGRRLALVYPSRIDVIDVESPQIEHSVTLDRKPFGVAVGIDDNLVV